MRKTDYILRFYFLCVIALFIGKINAQVKITGTVLDSISKQILPSANVTIFNKDNISTAVAIVTTNKKGVYRFNNIKKGEYFIDINYIGYKPGTILNIAVLDNTIELVLPPVYLSLNSVKLKDITVTGKVPFIVHSVDKTTVNIAESAISAGGNALEVLQRAPGVRVDENGNVTLNSKAVMMFVDGRPTYVTGEDLKNLLSAMPASAIDKLELIDNPGVKYDASAEAVINIKSLKGRNYGWNGTINTGIGSGKFLRYNTGLTFNNRGAKYNLYGGYDYARTKFFYLINENRLLYGLSYEERIKQIQYEEWDRVNQNLKIGIDIEPNKKLSFGLILKGVLTNRSTAINNKIFNIKNQIFTDTTTKMIDNGNLYINNPSLNVFYKQNLDNKGSTVQLNLDYLYTDRNYNDKYNFKYLNNLNENLFMTDNHFVSRNSIFNISSIGLDFSIPRKLLISGGGKFINSLSDNNLQWYNILLNNFENDTNRSNIFRYDEKIIAGYLTFNYKKKKLDFQLGVRAEKTSANGKSVTINEHFSRKFMDLFPQLSVSYEFSKSNNLKFSFRKSIRRVGYDYVNPFITSYGKYYYTQGNTNLQPQYRYTFSLNYSTGSKLSAQFNYAIGKGEISFIYKTKDSIKNILVGTYENLKSAFKINFVLNYNTTVFKKIQTNINYELIKYTLNIPGINLQKPVIVHYLTTNFIYQAKKILIEGNARINSSFRNEVNYVGIDYSYAVGFSKRVLNDRAKIKLNFKDFVNNFSNYTEFNYMNVYFRKSILNDTKTFNLSFIYRFGKETIKDSKSRPSSIENEAQRINLN